jgi:type I restriction enzyme S subunit
VIAGLKPYPAMKDSGVEWLGEVPEHWEVSAVKRHYVIQLGKMLQNRPIRPSDTEVRYLKAQHVQWFQVHTSEAPTMWANQKELDQFGLEKGDLLVCEGGEGGRCGIVQEDVKGLIIQNALHRVRGKNGNLNPYLQYVLSAIASAGWFAAHNDKATIAHFTAEKFGALQAPMPPVNEQCAIVRFLDHADQRIQRYIRAKEMLIALLEEQKQAIIHQAVTGQIDVRTGRPYLAYKDSGVEWLGQVPEHWDVRRLKSLCSMKSGEGITSEAIDPAGKFPVYGGNGIRGYTSSFTHDGWYVLIGRQGALCGNIHQVHGRFWASEHAVVAALASSHVHGWFAGILRAMKLNQYSIAAAQPGLAVERIMELALPVPDRHEQTLICGYLQEQLAKIASGLSTTERQLALVREFRVRLIADVVTGRFDVRNVTAQLVAVDTASNDDSNGYSNLTPEGGVETDQTILVRVTV